MASERAILVKITPAGLKLYDASDETVCVAALSAAEADRLCKDIRRALRERQELQHVQNELRRKGYIP